MASYGDERVNSALQAMALSLQVGERKRNKMVSVNLSIYLPVSPLFTVSVCTSVHLPLPYLKMEFPTLYFLKEKEDVIH